MIEFREVWECFEGVWGCFGKSRGVKRVLFDPYRGPFFPPRSPLWHQIWFQTPHDGPTGPC